MDTLYLQALDEYFCANYSDYVRLASLEGYERPDLLYIEKDGNIARRDPSAMRLSEQTGKAEILARFKTELADTDYTFRFSVASYFSRFRDLFRKHTFAKTLSGILPKYNETWESAGEKLEIEPRLWKMIKRGKLYPEKCTVLALALVCRMRAADLTSLLNVCGFELKKESVRDVVVSHLIEQKIFNGEMRDACLAEYRITTIPIKKQ